MHLPYLLARILPRPSEHSEQHDLQASPTHPELVCRAQHGRSSPAFRESRSRPFPASAPVDFPIIPKHAADWPQPDEARNDVRRVPPEAAGTSQLRSNPRLPRNDRRTQAPLRLGGRRTTPLVVFRYYGEASPYVPETVGGSTPRRIAHAQICIVTTDFHRRVSEIRRTQRYAACAKDARRRLQKCPDRNWPPRRLLPRRTSGLLRLPPPELAAPLGKGRLSGFQLTLAVLAAPQEQSPV